MLAHDNVVASIETFHRIVPPMEHRLVSLLPLSHLLEQAVGLFYALSVGADILYVRSRNPRVIFDALRDHRVTSMVVVPQVLDLFWSAHRARGRRSAAGRPRSTACGRSPGTCRCGIRPRLFGSIHTQLGGALPPVPVVRGVPAAGAPAGLGGPRRHGPAGLRRDRDRDRAPRTTLDDHGLGTVGRPPEGIEMRLAADGEIQFRGPTVFSGYWNAPDATAAAFTDGRLVPDRRHRPPRRCRPADPVGPDQGHHRPAQRVQRLSRGHRERPAHRRHPRLGRRRDAARADRGHRPGGSPLAGRRGRGRRPTDPAAIRARIDAAVKAANATLGPNQRIAGWRLWPEEDFPRTHTLKIKRAPVRAWVAAGRRRCRSPDSAVPAARSLATGNPTPSVSSASWIQRRRLILRRGRQPVVEDDRRADPADDVHRPSGVWTRAGSRREVALLLRRGLGGARRHRRTRRPR